LPTQKKDWGIFSLLKTLNGFKGNFLEGSFTPFGNFLHIELGALFYIFAPGVFKKGSQNWPFLWGKPLLFVEKIFSPLFKRGP